MKWNWPLRRLRGATEEDKEIPMRIPTFFDLPVDMPPVAGRGPEFIGGADAYWCWNQWLVVKIPNAEKGARCPLCDKSVVFIAGVMAGQKEKGNG